MAIIYSNWCCQLRTFGRLFFKISIEDTGSFSVLVITDFPLLSATQNLGAGGARLHWMVCLQISSLQGKRFIMFGLFVVGLCMLLNVFVQSAPVLVSLRSSRRNIYQAIQANNINASPFFINYNLSSMYPASWKLPQVEIMSDRTDNGL